MNRWTSYLAAGVVGAALLLGFAGLSMAHEEGTGLDPGDTRGGLAMMNWVLGTDWKDAREEHQDYVEDFGIFDCEGCHVVEAVGYVDDYAPGCLTCHEPEFCGTPGTSELRVCKDEDDLSGVQLSVGTQDMNDFLGVNFTIWAEDHQDLVEDTGVDACTDCHDLNSGGKLFSASTFDAPGCLSCHDREWDDDRDDRDHVRNWYDDRDDRDKDD